MFCKGRIKGFRSLYTQWPTQSSVLCRRFLFNYEVEKYAHALRIVCYCGNTLALTQKLDVKRIPGYAAQCVITSPPTFPACLHYIYEGENFF